MRRKAVFFLAGIFLVVALVVPPALLFLQADHDLDNIILTQNPNGLQTNGNVTLTQETTENHQTTFVLVALVEVVFVVLFVIMIYLGISYKPPKM